MYLAVINVWVLYKECTRSKISRKDFIFQLAIKLASENKENELNIPLLSFSNSQVLSSVKSAIVRKIKAIRFVISVKRSFAENVQEKLNT